MKKADQTTLTAVHNELLVGLGGKASSQALTVAQNTLQASIDTKADIGLTNSIQDQVNNTVKASNGSFLSIRKAMSC